MMRSVSEHIAVWIPALIALLLVWISSVPLSGGSISLTPNIAWLMTLVMAAVSPLSWPRGLAFALGLLQDFLFGTPLGSQALLALALAQLAAVQASRHPVQLFRVRWLEAAGVLMVWHGLLWLLMVLVHHDGAHLRGLLEAGLVNALWYPLWYGVASRIYVPRSEVGR